jgi:UDP-N-acetylmuramoylalanine--D-glutamate ligase
MHFHCNPTKKTLILGLGRTGRSVSAWLTRHGYGWLSFDDQLLDADLRAVEEIPWNDIERVVQSPGIPHLGAAMHPVRRCALERKIPIITDLDLFHAHLQSDRRCIGITGTNGKSSTTALIHHLLQACGMSAAIGGNFGTPFLDIVDPGPGGIYVLELSSYQLDLAQPTPFEVAVWLNMTPDLLDRHLTWSGYRAG